VPSYFKDATFGVRAGDVARTETPEAGLTIVRDGYDVPHIYGDTRAELMFGAGYAGAEDRLFLMDVLRHTGRATLSSFAGGSRSNRAMDEGQWALAPYTEQDLQAQIDAAPRLYGAAGAPRLR
jgi:acyl-homoserine lactone acylase PvdQ